MDPNVVLPMLSSLVSFVFALMVFDQWLRLRRPYQLVWTVGLLWYGISAGTEFLGSLAGWNEPLYRAWYLFGAFGVAAYMGLGTVFLLSRTRFGYFVAFSVAAGGAFSILSAAARAREGEPASSAVLISVVGLSVVAALAIAIATRRERRFAGPVTAALLLATSAVVTLAMWVVPIDPPGYALAPDTGVPVGTALPSEIRILTPPFNIFGALVLVFGALYSAYIFMPKRRLLNVRSQVPVIGTIGRGLAVLVNWFASLPATFAAGRRGTLHSRVPATLLIALGAFIPGITSGLSRFGITWGFFLGELLGILLIFSGFLVSIEVFRDIRIPFTRIVLVRRPPADVVDTPAPPA
jgi:hypothetical protein